MPQGVNCYIPVEFSLFDVVSLMLVERLVVAEWLFGDGFELFLD